MFLLADWLGFVAVSGLVLGTFGLGEMLRYRSRWASERTRKFAHIGCGVLIFFFPYMFKSVHTVGVLAATFLALLLSTKLLGFMQSVHAVRRNTGGVYYYPVSIYFTALLTWDHPAVFQICVLLLALADGLAALVGKAYGRHRYHLGAHVRTLEGSATVLVVSWISTFALLSLSGLTSMPAAAIIGVVLSGLICAVEALSLWGVDNLLIPLVSAVFLNAAIHWPMPTLWWHLGACLIAFGVATACQLKGYLKLNGAVAAWMVSYLTLGLGGVGWYGPMLMCFLGINWVGKLAERMAGHRLPPGFERIEEKGSRRDFVQIFSNAGVALALVIAHSIVRGSHPALAQTLFWAFIGALCAATADTFASEVGVLSKSRPVLLWTLEPVPAGLSGGVTFFGYGAAAAGALVPLAGLALLGSPYPFGLGAVVGAVACGWIGSTVDSLVGATLQAKRKCAVCDRILEKSEHCGVPTAHFRGHPLINNDLVNAIGAFSGALAGALLLNGWL